MTEDELRAILKRNPALSVGSAGPAAVMERPACNGPLAARQGEEGSPGRVHIRVVSVRQRLLDPDNISPKWAIDCLRYCRAIRGDEPDKITLETTQRKAAKGEAERTIVEVFQL